MFAATFHHSFGSVPFGADRLRGAETHQGRQRFEEQEQRWQTLSESSVETLHG